MAKTCVYAAIILCTCTDPCLAYRLVGSEALSDALVARHYTINATLDAVIVVDKTVPTFEYQTFFAMGHADEPEGEQGKLHFLEHIIAGTGSRPVGELNQLIARNGGEHQAFTGRHMTYFTMTFPTDKLALAVEIDRDRFYRTLFDAEFNEKRKADCIDGTQQDKHPFEAEILQPVLGTGLRKGELRRIGYRGFD